MEEVAPRPPVQAETVVDEEQLAEAVRLQHGLAVLDWFTKEDETEDRREQFLRVTRPGSESRAEILAGPSYDGDEHKLQLAIAKAQKRFAIYDIRRQAMLEHAGFLNIPAEIKDKQVVAENPEDQKRLGIEHGKWRSQFASKHNQQARMGYRNFLSAKLQSIAGVCEETSALSDGPFVDLEERAVLLTRAVNAMARRSMLSGLGVAVADERYNEPVYTRYQEKTGLVDQRSERKVDRLLDSARRDFWRASGYDQIRKSGLMKEYLLRRRAQKMWKEFAGQFEHAPQQSIRVRFRKQLRRYISIERLPETYID